LINEKEGDAGKLIEEKEKGSVGWEEVFQTKKKSLKN